MFVLWFACVSDKSKVSSVFISRNNMISWICLYGPLAFQAAIINNFDTIGQVY